VILPKRNEQDIDDVPEEIKKALKFVYAETVDDVIASALEKPEAAAKSESSKPKAASKKKSNGRKSNANGKSSSRRR
jgi:ATP-dependent Lon protease